MRANCLLRKDLHQWRKILFYGGVTGRHLPFPSLSPLRPAESGAERGKKNIRPSWRDREPGLKTPVYSPLPPSSRSRWIGRTTADEPAAPRRLKPPHNDTVPTPCHEKRSHPWARPSRPCRRRSQNRRPAGAKRGCSAAEIAYTVAPRLHHWDAGRTWRAGKMRNLRQGKHHGLNDHPSRQGQVPGRRRPEDHRHLQAPVPCESSAHPRRTSRRDADADARLRPVPAGRTRLEAHEARRSRRREGLSGPTYILRGGSP